MTRKKPGRITTKNKRIKLHFDNHLPTCDIVKRPKSLDAKCNCGKDLNVK
jgi:hypothetical protein